MKERFLFKKNIIFDQYGVIGVQNFNIMKEYIEFMIDCLINEKDDSKKLINELYDNCFEVIDYDLNNSVFDEHAKQLIKDVDNKKYFESSIKSFDFSAYIGNVLCWYHFYLIKNKPDKIPQFREHVIMNSVSLNEIYNKSLEDYFRCITFDGYSNNKLDSYGLPKQKQPDIFNIKDGNNEALFIKNEHAYVASFMLPALIERVLYIDSRNRICYYSLQKLKNGIANGSIILDDDENNIYDIILVNPEKSFKLEYIDSIYNIYTKYGILNQNDDTKSIFYDEKYVRDKTKHSSLMMGDLLESSYFKSVIKERYFKLLSYLFRRNEINARNNIYHLSTNANLDYCNITFTSIFVQILWDVFNGNVFKPFEEWI